MLQLRQTATDKVIPFLLVSSANQIHGGDRVGAYRDFEQERGSICGSGGNGGRGGEPVVQLTPTSEDTNTAAPLVLHETAAGADPSDRECRVVSFDPFDAAVVESVLRSRPREHNEEHD